MKNIPPTKTLAWQKLQVHFEKTKNVSLQNLFKRDPNRAEKYTLQLEDLSVDFSKNHLDQTTVALLTEFAKEMGLSDAINAYFSGGIINATENRAVLHTALRANNTVEKPLVVHNENIRPVIARTFEKMKSFTNRVLSGHWKGHTGKTVTDVVNIGIGGSDLGPQMVVEALQFYKTPLNIHFIYNIDGDHTHHTLQKLNPETTLFIIVSKTFTTQETITNAQTVQKWFLKNLPSKAVAQHFVAVSTNLQAVEDFGITPENIFPMWDWVGGRFSLWSAVGLSIALGVGFENFEKLLQGANAMDTHFHHTDFEKNIPVMLALISVWYNNFYRYETEAVLPYAQSLEKTVSYLQQAVMESNGKSVDRNGQKIDYQTGNIIWGSTGTNAQHAFMQLVHQGTKKMTSDFIGYQKSLYGDENHHQKLMANYYGQMQALCYGRDEKAVLETFHHQSPEEIKRLAPFKIFEGNRPSTSILQEKLTPYSLGILIAMYEHKIFVQGVLWNIYSFDQWGVELGKELANQFLTQKK